MHALVYFTPSISQAQSKISKNWIAHVFVTQGYTCTWFPLRLFHAQNIRSFYVCKPYHARCKIFAVEKCSYGLKMHTCMYMYFNNNKKNQKKHKTHSSGFTVTLTHGVDQQLHLLPHWWDGQRDPTAVQCMHTYDTSNTYMYVAILYMYVCSCFFHEHCMYYVCTYMYMHVHVWQCWKVAIVKYTYCR